VTEQSSGPPPRLVDLPGAAGDCVRDALATRERPCAVPRFTALQERRTRRARRHALLSIAAVVALGAFGARALHQPEPVLSVSAEPVALAPASVVAPPPSAPPSAAPKTEQRAAVVEAPQKVPHRPKTPVVALAPAPVAAPTTAPSAATMPTVAELNGGAKGCAELARGGAPQDAIDCYARLASGSGVTAELAMFEQARLAGKVLRQPARALMILDQYRERFPRGSLRAEVMLARIDWLLGAGNKAGALVAVDEALASGLLKERSAELERLRSSLEASAGAR